MITNKRDNCVIITAYKDYTQLKSLVDFFAPIYNIYIHISSKSELIRYIEELNAINAVEAFSKYNTSWGSYDHLLAIFECVNKAVKTTNNGYIHIISGQDMPIKGIDEFDRYFRDNRSVYMTCSAVDGKNRSVLSRIIVRNHFWKMDLNSKYLRTIILYITIILSYFPGRRKVNLNTLGKNAKLYKGMVWISAPCEVFSMCVINGKELLGFLETVLIPEEFFFQTLIMNSKYSEDVIFNNLRYTLWETRDGMRPAFWMNEILKVLLIVMI